MDNSICQVYEDKIQSLEEEIKLLTEKYEDYQQESTFYSDEEILMSKKSFQREFWRPSQGYEYLPDLRDQLESLEMDLSFIMKFTGIHFTSHFKKTVEKTRNRTVWKHRLSGNCHSLSFQVEFQLLEVQLDPTSVFCVHPSKKFLKNKENVSVVVSDLSVLMSCGGDSYVSKFVSSIEEHGNLLQFFRSLSSYAEWYEHRRCTFLHFKAKYPNFVALPEGLLGHYIILRNPKPSGFELMVVWKIHIDEEGRITPLLDLLTKVPEQVLAWKMAAIENAPTGFRSMLLLFGIEAAIENLIKVVSLGK
ncbi:centromere protein P isoform X1 [Athene cunicularia]|uniref:centromere protein P isoform X1 n=1 Tax=Athene cunicularia TaxID=194338 RepID=UPI000EF6CC4A|nr:centromere protein P isoform X1 [Athene cunicularia]